jgi:hypothetical protein
MYHCLKIKEHTTANANVAITIIFAGRYVGADAPVKVKGPMMLAAPYATRTTALIVIFFVWPA